MFRWHVLRTSVLVICHNAVTSATLTTYRQLQCALKFFFFMQP